MEYAKDLEDPEKKRKMEDELVAYEKQNGKDVKLMRPEPVWCVKIGKMKRDFRVSGCSNGDSPFIKLFVNICKSDMVDEAIGSTENGGTLWKFPHRYSPPSVAEAVKHDVTFHPATIQKAMLNEKFKLALVDSALESLQLKYNYEFDRKGILFNIGYKILTRKCMGSPVTLSISSASDPSLGLKTAPKYDIIERQSISIGSDASSLYEKPSELIIRLFLPGVKSSSEISIDIQQSKDNRRHSLLKFDSILYKMDINLKYAVDTSNALCKFEVDTEKLEICVPIKHIK